MHILNKSYILAVDKGNRHEHDACNDRHNDHDPDGGHRQKNQLRTDGAHFVYMKKSGELREAFGTTSKALVERYINGNGISREHYATTAYFDVEKAAWRSFKWENIVAVL